MEVLWNTEKPIGEFSPFLKLTLESNSDILSTGISIFPTSQKISNAFERPHKTVSEISIMMEPMIILGFKTSSKEKSEELNNLITLERIKMEEESNTSNNIYFNPKSYFWDNNIHPESDKFVYANIPWDNKKYIETIFNFVSKKFSNCSIEEENIKEIMEILNSINI